MITINKKIINKFGTHYLLGINYEGEKVYLEDFSWDCKWYWGGGYLHTFTNNNNPEASRDISSHTHFDGLKTIEKVETVKTETGEYKTFWDRRSVNLYDGFKAHFKKSVLSDSELWQLCDLMKSFYTMREAAEWFKGGKSNYTNIPGSIVRPEMQKLCNTIIEEEIAPKIRELLSPMD